MVAELDGDTLTVVVRSASIDRLCFLDQALFSLATQHWAKMEVLVMLQSPTEQFAQAVRDLVTSFPWSEDARVYINAVTVGDGVDGRARLLSEGIANGTGRYLAFLDDDDVVYARGYKMLIEALRRSTSSAIAVGDCRIAHVVEEEGAIHIERKIDGFFRRVGQSKFDLLVENFIPIHSYVLDRDRISVERLTFRDEAIPLEDYDFLLRLADGHEFDLSLCNVPVCEYRMHADNTLWLNSKTKDASPKLRRAREFITDMKRSAVFSVTPLEMEQLKISLGLPYLPSREALGTPFLVRKAIALDSWIRRHAVFHSILAGLLRSARRILGQA